MNPTMIEAIGYLGSALVLVSFLMVSVVKLRIVNSIGSIIFTIYAFIIHSYPTAIMNLCLVLINVYYLIKLTNTGSNSRAYELVKASPNDAMLKYTLDKQKEDIEKFFPGLIVDLSEINSAYIICHNGSPAGLFLGNTQKDHMDIVLDYTMPAYRDFSIGKFLFTKLPEEGLKTLTYSGPSEFNKEYLDKYNFIKEGNSYTKIL